MALAWYAITAEFDRQTNRGGDDALAKTAAQRAQALQATLLPGDLERAQQAGQSEFKQIVEALQPPKPPAVPAAVRTAASRLAGTGAATGGVPGARACQAMAPPAADAEPDPPGWPKAANDQISVIQQALVELKFLSDKPDGVIGPMTRAAIRTFQRSIGARETGEPTKDVFAALQQAMARRNAAASAPPAPATIDLGTPEPPPAPPTSADIARAAPESGQRSRRRRASGRARESRTGKRCPGEDRPAQAADAQRRGGDARFAAGRGHVRTAQAGATRNRHRSRPARAAAGAADLGRHRARRSRCVAGIDRRPGDGDPAPAARPQLLARSCPTASTVPPRAPPSSTSSARRAWRRPASPARRCSNR